jgi:hypothetical protein
LLPFTIDRPYFIGCAGETRVDYELLKIVVYFLVIGRDGGELREA